ncbi:MAG: hypothetical protein LBK76_04930, partial [Verrucomicrobiales bacterium]|nr:hypothetical protein [Verrucomicrobiales bacterium]
MTKTEYKIPNAEYKISNAKSQTPINCQFPTANLQTITLDYSGTLREFNPNGTEAFIAVTGLSVGVTGLFVGVIGLSKIVLYSSKIITDSSKIIASLGAPASCRLMERGRPARFVAGWKPALPVWLSAGRHDQQPIFAKTQR